MISLGRILRDYQESGALNSLVPIHAAIDDGVFITKGGDLLIWLAVQGADYECLDPAETDHIARRFESALRSLDERFRLYQYVLKRESAELPSDTYPDPVVAEAVRSRVRYLAQDPERLSSTETYMAVVYEGWRPKERRMQAARWINAPVASLRHLLSAKETLQATERELEQARDLLASKVESLAIQLRDVVPV